MKRVGSLVTGILIWAFLTQQLFAAGITNFNQDQLDTSGLTSATAGLQGEGLSVNVSPQYPAPGQAVNFSLQDFQDDLSVATISWSVNGKVIHSGIGDTTFQTIAGPSGKSETIEANVIPQSGAPITRSSVITPEGVDILWQAHSYVPPFYRGKALFPYQGSITVTAMPTFALTNPKNAVYTWQLGGEAMPDVSGAGKNTITLTGSILLQPIALSVVVTSIDTSLIAQNSITLTGTNPSLVMYEENPLYGLLLNHAVGAALTLNGQTGLNAVPYFFDSTAPFTNTATFQWSMNGTAITNQTTQALVVAAPAGQSGNSTVSVSASNSDSSKPFQTASGNVSVTFTATQ